MSNSSRDAASASQHSRGFSISSILSYMSGSGEQVATPIKQVRAAPQEDDSHAQAPMPKVEYPDASSFAVDNILQATNSAPLEQSLVTAVTDTREQFSKSISELASEQGDLVRQMQTLDALTKETLMTINGRVRKSERQAEMLLGGERLTLLAEKTYTDVGKIVRLFQEIDDLLPPTERIRHHKTHYTNLAPLISDRDTITKDDRPQRRIASTPAISSLRSIVENSPPVKNSGKHAASSEQTVKQMAAEGPAEPQVDALPPMRLRLAPRKSKSNLRVPQLRTVPPLPSTQQTTSVLPTVERDNMSTRTSIASHRSIFSTISYYLGGQSSRTLHNEAMTSRPSTSAEETLRKISGSSNRSGRRQASGLRSASGLR